MTRWIIAGVLLALLVLLVVSDELGGGTMVGGDGDGAAGAFQRIGADGVENTDTDDKPKDAVEARCAHVVDVLTEKGGVAYMDSVGDVLYDDKGWTTEQMDELCVSLKGKSNAEIFAKMVELSGVSP